MKNQPLTIFFSLALILGVIIPYQKSEASNPTCIEVTLSCGIETLACGSTFEEIMANAAMMERILCNVE